MPNQKNNENDERPDEELTEGELELRIEEHARQAELEAGIEYVWDDDDDDDRLTDDEREVEYYQGKKIVIHQQNSRLMDRLIDSFDVSPKVKKRLKSEVRIKIYFEE